MGYLMLPKTQTLEASPTAVTVNETHNNKEIPSSLFEEDSPSYITCDYNPDSPVVKFI